ncbi:MAG: tetratricopeptide repeat protein [Bryobacteraceae bacterium]|jgi:tetratricopeptide (TPR) repeat protein
MISRCLAALVIAGCALPVAGEDAASGYAGSEVCGKCHAAQFESQSKTAHAHALRRAQATDPGPGSHAQWAFGAGTKAVTWVSQTGEETIAEHGQSYYAATKSLALTPGHTSSADIVYRTFDPIATALRCFRCHSTGPVTLAAGFQVQPGEPGIHCEACHGPGRAHAESGGAAAIQNPKRLSAGQINTLCGACHRQASDLDDDTDWSNTWNVRHQPSYLHRAACFRNSNGALSCLTCHDPHQPLKTAASAYDARCTSCHPKAAHTTPIAARSCVGCHMPQVATSANLRFTNHWIGIYDPRGRNLIPSKRAVTDLHPVLAKDESANGMIVPADPSTLAPVYAQAVAERQRESGPDSAKAARASADFGQFLLLIEKSAEAEAPLRRAVAIDEHNADSAIDADRESLALALEAQGKRKEAFEYFRQAAQGRNPRVAARAFAKLAGMDRDHADIYSRNAVASEEKASGTDSPRVALLLQEYALALRARDRDPEAEPLLRRALSIQQSAAKADPQVTVTVLNTLGNLLEGRKQLDEAEKLERLALTVSEQRFGPESVQLAMTCTNLADVLWNKKNLREAGRLYRRAIGVDASLYGPDRPETADDIANLGMLMNDAGQPAAGAALLRQALAIYEKTLGPASERAQFVRQRLVRPGR